MISYASPTYLFELFDSNGTPLADITSFFEKPSIALEVNEAETITGSMDMQKFDDFCKRQLGGIDGLTLLQEYQTDIKVKRNESDFVGTHVDSVGVDAGASSETISVIAKGYLEFFSKREITKTYSGYDSAMIARDLIAQTQTRPRGNVGVTLRPSPYLSGVGRDMTYQRSNIKKEMIDLAESKFGPFEFAFFPDKSFQTYQRLGANNGLSLVYGENMTGVQVDRLGSRIYNYITGVGSGFGSDQIASVQEDATDQLRHYLREKTVQFNSVVNQTTLDQNTLSELANCAPLAIPIIKTNTVKLRGVLPGLGDVVSVDLNAKRYLASLSGAYRIIRIEIDLDEQHMESISLYLGAAS